MITVTVFRFPDKSIKGFSISGHSGYADEGHDIICSAVSILSQNTVNSVEKFTTAEFESEVKEGYLRFILKSKDLSFEDKEKTGLLLNSFILGIESITAAYGNRFVRLQYVD